MGGGVMNEVTVLLSETQQKALQAEFYQLITNEIKHFRSELGLNEKYIKKHQVCHYLNLSNNTVDKLIAEGMPRINIRGVILYDKIAIDKWLKNHNHSA